MACRFPGGASDPESFWQLLRAGFDANREIPRGRFDIDDYYDPAYDKAGKMYVRRGAFMDDVDLFDAAFFGISPREAERMDPQQRLLLETGWEAIEDAGQDPLGVAKSAAVGVFVGISSNDYGRLQGGAHDLDAYVGTGNALSIAANRLSY